MLFASAFIAFDVRTRLWSGPRRHVRLASSGTVSLGPNGRIIGLPLNARKRSLLLRTKVDCPKLGRCMALQDEYEARYWGESHHWAYPMPCMRHGNVLIFMDKAGSMTRAVVFYARGNPLASLDDLAVNFMCLSLSFYDGRLSRVLYLGHLRASGILTRVNVDNATDDERAAAMSLLRLSAE